MCVGVLLSTLSSRMCARRFMIEILIHTLCLFGKML